MSVPFLRSGPPEKPTYSPDGIAKTGPVLLTDALVRRIASIGMAARRMRLNRDGHDKGVANRAAFLENALELIADIPCRFEDKPPEQRQSCVCASCLARRALLGPNLNLPFGEVRNAILAKRGMTQISVSLAMPLEVDAAYLLKTLRRVAHYKPHKPRRPVTVTVAVCMEGNRDNKTSRSDGGSRIGSRLEGRKAK